MQRAPIDSRTRPHHLHAIVLAGGSGRRLLPFVVRLTGEAIPKQFCRFGSDRSLLQQTIDRIAPLVPSGQVTVVVDRTHFQRARAQLFGERGLHLVEQPCDRGTAAGVLLPLLHVYGRSPDVTIVLLASDHGVVQAEGFRQTIDAAARSVRSTRDAIVLIGAEPDAPTTDYGWIVRSGAGDGGAEPTPVARFVEKPTAEEALELLASGRALWNTMVLVTRARTLLQLFVQQFRALTVELAHEIAMSGDHLGFAAYQALPRADFSADLLAKANRLSVMALPRSVGWTDLGTEPRLRAWLDRPVRSERQVAPGPFEHAAAPIGGPTHQDPVSGDAAT